MSKIGEAWEKIFTDLNLEDSINSNGYIYLTANKIKEVGKHEPRLMTKFDSSESRPDILKAYNISIFSVTNGTYILFKDETKKTYYSFPEYKENPLIHTSKIDLSTFSTFPSGVLTTESQTIDFAHISSILASFTGQEELYLTLRGRTRSGKFSFKLPSREHIVNVDGVQIELDAGFESPNAIYILEAKIGKRDNFHIRQLYYPYLEWSQKTGKKIVPIFFTYSNGLFYLTELTFNNTFGDLTINRTSCYILNESPRAKIDLRKMLNIFQVESEGEPFPQANDLDKIIDLANNIEQGINTKTKISDFFDFNERQGDYYANALLYLGFTEKESTNFTLTTIGKHFIQHKSRNERTRVLFSQLLKRPIFRELIQLLLERDFNLASISQNEIAFIIEKNTTLSGTTPMRRASTVNNWLQWLLKNSEL